PFGGWGAFSSKLPTFKLILSSLKCRKYSPATAAVSGQPSKVVSETLFPAAIAAEEIPTEVPSSRAVLISNQEVSLLSRIALFFEIPAFLAISETFLSLLLNTLLPAPK